VEQGRYVKKIKNKKVEGRGKKRTRKEEFYCDQLEEGGGEKKQRKKTIEYLLLARLVTLLTCHDDKSELKTLQS